MAMDHEAVLGAPAEDRQRIMQEMCEGEGPDGLVAWISSARSDETRRKLFSHAQNHLDLRNWPAGNLDAYVQVSRAGIAEYVRQSDSTAIDDTELSSKLLDSANMLSYNLSASLADCWPGDDTPRERRHYSEGYSAAEQCLRWREQLGKGPYSLQMAYWAQGIHLLALDDKPGALEAWEQALEQAEEYSRTEGKPTEPGPEAHFVLLLALGNRGIARLINGDSAGQADFDDAAEYFGVQARSGVREIAEEAEIGLGQLRKVYQQRVLGLGARAQA